MGSGQSQHIRLTSKIIENENIDKFQDDFYDQEKWDQYIQSNQEYQQIQPKFEQFDLQKLSQIKISKCQCIGEDNQGQKLSYGYDAIEKKFKNFQIPQNLDIFSFSSCVYLSPQLILISGGIQMHTQQVQRSFNIWDSESDKIIKMPDMRRMRYQHTSIFFQNAYYVFGGKRIRVDYEDSYMNHCECFSFETSQWENISPILQKRCQASALIYLDQIYIFGGNSLNDKRIRSIERYNPFLNSWERLNYKLHKGIDNGICITQGFKNQFLLIGGRISGGATKNVDLYDFKFQNVHTRPKMLKARAPCRGFHHEGYVYIFDGSEEDGIEVMRLKDFKWNIYPNQTFFNLIDINLCSRLTQISPPSIMHEDIQQNYVSKTPIEDKVYIFGTDQEPFILELDMKTGFSINKPVPLGMREFSFQNGTYVGKGKFLLMGGAREYFDKVMKHCFIYDAKSESGKKVQSMQYETFAFATIYKKPFFYVLGGRQSVNKTGQESKAIIPYCQRYNIEHDIWDKISPLLVKRMHSNSSIFNDKIYIWGGYTGNNQRTLTIEVYIENMDQWNAIDFQMKIPIEGATFHQISENEILIMGGKSNKGKLSQVWKFQLEENKQKKQEMKVLFQEVGNIGAARWNHKVYLTNIQNMLLIFGGPSDRPIDCFCLETKQIIENDDLEENITKFSEQIQKLNDSFLQSYCLLTHNTLI